MALGCGQDQGELRGLQQTNQVLAQENEALKQENQTLTRQVQTLRQENQALADKAQELEEEVADLEKTADTQKRAAVEKKTPGAQPGAGGETARGFYHRVKRGETLYQIGRTYGVSYRDLARANNIRNPSQIKVGQQILIPRVTR
jgi:LysM repeat protein